MEQIVRKADQSSVVLGDQTMDRFIGVEKAGPRHAGDLGRKRGWTGAAVKRVVAIPQGKPLLEVIRGHEANGEIVGHCSVRDRGGLAGPEMDRGLFFEHDPEKWKPVLP